MNKCIAMHLSLYGCTIEWKENERASERRSRGWMKQSKSATGNCEAQSSDSDVAAATEWTMNTWQAGRQPTGQQAARSVEIVY